jgi:hypothetical protein
MEIEFYASQHKSLQLFLKEVYKFTPSQILAGHTSRATKGWSAKKKIILDGQEQRILFHEAEELKKMAYPKFTARELKGQALLIKQKALGLVFNLIKNLEDEYSSGQIDSMNLLRNSKSLIDYIQLIDDVDKGKNVGDLGVGEIVELGNGERVRRGTRSQSTHNNVLSIEVVENKNKDNS